MQKNITQSVDQENVMQTIEDVYMWILFRAKAAAPILQTHQQFFIQF